MALPAIRQMYRQGDVILIKIGKKPKGLKKNKDKVLAWGEATGHRHEVLDGEVSIDADGTLYVEAKDGTVLSHHKGGAPADHKPITLPEGTYEVRIQKTYEPQGWKQVSD